MLTLREDLLRRAAFGCLRLSEALRRGREGIAAAAQAAALAGLSDAALVALTAELFDGRRGRDDGALFDWEEAWLAADLPPAPARLLVGGAGSGREVSPLAARGYEILAFDPAPRLVEVATRRFGGDPRVEFVEGCYEEMADRRPGALRDALARRERFDAILFGWGSFTHIAAAKARVGALCRARELCPTGPALLSFWIREEQGARRAALGARLGAEIGRLWAGGRAREAAAGDSLVGHAGFCHAFTWDELEALAAEGGYAVHRSSRDRPAPYPHVTLRPLGRGAREGKFGRA